MKNTLNKYVFGVSGMSCATCAQSVEQAVNRSGLANKAMVNFASHTLSVESEKQPDLGVLTKIVSDAGFELFEIDENEMPWQKSDGKRRDILKRFFVSLFFTLPVFYFSMFSDVQSVFAIMFQMVATAIVLSFGGKMFFTGAFKRLKHLEANMDSLIALGTGTAFIYSSVTVVLFLSGTIGNIYPHLFFESASVVTTLVLLGKYLEENARKRMTDNLTLLVGLNAKTACIFKDGTETRVPASKVLKGDIIVVRDGEKIPVDGIILNGGSYMDESMITGESMPVYKTIGQKVFGASINQSGQIEIKAYTDGGKGLLSQMIEMVGKAQATKAPVQQLADKVASVFVPSVLLLSVLVFLVWVLLGGVNAWVMGLQSAVNVLVIACPCALGLATPAAVVAAMGTAATRGILFHNAESLEELYKADIFAFDKTGTLTLGKPLVINELWLVDEVSKQKFLSEMAAFLRVSSHPLSAAVSSYLEKYWNKDLLVEHILSVPGKGFTAKIKDEIWFSGSWAFMLENGIDAFEEKALKSFENNCHGSLVYVAQGRKIIVVFELSDILKPGVKELVNNLESKGKQVFLLSGDGYVPVKTIAKEAGIGNFKAGMLPLDKIETVKNWQKEGKKVAFIGDGINDSPALAQANIGIAMSSGSDIAIGSATVTLTGTNPGLLVNAFEISHKARVIIRQNLFWAFGYNVAALPLAAGLLYPFSGYLMDPMIAGVAMACSSVSVVANSLRLKS